MDHSQCKIAWDKLHLQSRFFKTVKAYNACESLHGQNNTIRIIEQSQSNPRTVHGN
jgi:hypothetical protein